MRKNTISKILLLLLTLTLIICISPKVYAENNTTDDDNIPDLMNQINSGNTTTGNNTLTGSGNNTITGNNTTVGNNTSTGNNTTTATKNNTTAVNNTTSSYEETKIPYAGPAETILMSVAFIVCAIIGIYTFIKLSEYSNI